MHLANLFRKSVLSAYIGLLAMPSQVYSQNAIPVESPSTQAPLRQQRPIVAANPSSLSSTSSSSSLTAQLLEKVDQLQQELASLRGQLEQQGYQIKQMQQNTRDRYLDLDTRLSALSSSGASPAASTEQKKPLVNPSVTGSRDTKANQAYQTAFTLLGQRKFDEAIVSLNNFLKKYPESNRAANAQYWLGELYLAQQKYSNAEVAFKKVLNQYPGNNKSADAMYKLGIVWSQMGKIQKAKTELNKVIKTYPKSSAAKLANDYLKTLH